MAEVAENPQDDESGSVDLAEVGSYASAAQAWDHGLVVLAMGLSYWLDRGDGRYHLLVERPFTGQVLEEIACFDRESSGWPPPPPVVERSPGKRRAMLTPLLWALAVLAVFNLQNARPGLVGRADLDTWAVFHRGEWWRPATALFLHADVGHLTANVIFGFFIFTAVVATLGTGRGWLLLAVAAIIGNVASAAMRYPGPYRSIGASTAIFAGIGLLTGRAIRAVPRGGPARPWYPLLGPLAAGAALLGFLGAGGGNTDIGAHATGFAAGLLLGLAAPGLGPRQSGSV